VKRRAKTSLFKKLLYTLVAVVLTWLFVEAEILVWLWVTPPEERVNTDWRTLYKPHPNLAFAGVPNRMDRLKACSANSFGLRGPQIAPAKPPDTVRIICLGGSTTYSVGATSNSTTWPARMERLLREQYRNAPFRVEVVNAGIPGYTSIESLVQLETQLLDLSPDVAVISQGINDCWFMLSMFDFQSDYTHARRTFTLPQRKLWEWSPLLALLFAKNSMTNPYFPVAEVNLNEMVITCPEILTHPERARHGPLEERMAAVFERNTRSLVSVARANGAIPVLSTQSYQDDTPSKGYWTPAMNRLNAVTLEVAAREAVDVIDFARLFPWNPVDFADKCHLWDSPGGLGRQAELFARGLIERRVIERAWEARSKRREAGGRK